MGSTTRTLSLGILIIFAGSGMAQANWRATDVTWEKDGKSILKVSYFYAKDGKLERYLANGDETSIEYPDASTRVDRSSKGKKVSLLDSKGRAITTELYDLNDKLNTTYYTSYDESKPMLLQISTKIKVDTNPETILSKSKVSYGQKGELISVREKIFNANPPAPVLKKRQWRRFVYDKKGNRSVSFLVHGDRRVQTSRFLQDTLSNQLKIFRDSDGDGIEETTITYSFEEGDCDVPSQPNAAAYLVVENCRDTL